MIRKYYMMLAVLIGASTIVSQPVLANGCANCMEKITTATAEVTKDTTKEILKHLPVGSTVSATSFSNLIPTLADLYKATWIAAPIVGAAAICLGTRDAINGFFTKDDKNNKMWRGIWVAAAGSAFILLRLGAVPILGDYVVSIPTQG